MKELNINQAQSVAGGEIVAGWPTPEIQCLNVKLMVAMGRGAPGFDITVASNALVKYCHDDFWDFTMAHEYATSGGIPG